MGYSCVAAGAHGNPALAMIEMLTKAVILT